MKKITMILLAMFTLSGCDRQEMIYSFNHVEEASVDNEVENTESVDNIQSEKEQAVDITTEEPEISKTRCRRQTLRLSIRKLSLAGRN